MVVPLLSRVSERHCADAALIIDAPLSHCIADAHAVSAASTARGAFANSMETGAKHIANRGELLNCGSQNSKDFPKVFYHATALCLAANRRSWFDSENARKSAETIVNTRVW
jgi:hypothetical protein